MVGRISAQGGTNRRDGLKRSFSLVNSRFPSHYYFSLSSVLTHFNRSLWVRGGVRVRVRGGRGVKLCFSTKRLAKIHFAFICHEKINSKKKMWKTVNFLSVKLLKTNKTNDGAGSKV